MANQARPHPKRTATLSAQTVASKDVSETLWDVVVVGEGWTSVLSVAALGKAGKRVLWVSGSGAKLWPSTPGISQIAAQAPLAELNALLESYGLDALTLSAGEWTREYKNRAFQPLRDVSLDVENACVPETGSFIEAAERLKEALAGSGTDSIVPAEPRSIEALDGQYVVELSNQARVRTRRVLYADRLNGLLALESARPFVPFAQEWSRQGRSALAIQWSAYHPVSALPEFKELFVLTMQKESGEASTRSFHGYFFDSGRRSVWTLIVDPEEAEDNHLLMKRLRRIKQGLSKAFDEVSQAQGGGEWLKSVVKEQVRFENDVLFELRPGGFSRREFALGGTEEGSFSVLSEACGHSEALVQWSEQMQAWRASGFLPHSLEGLPVSHGDRPADVDSMHA